MKNKKKNLEFSKKLTMVDIAIYAILTFIILIILLIRPELGTFAQNIFAYLTTAYVSLRLGYTAKAGVENYKKIAQTYKEVTTLNSAGDYESTSSGYEDETVEEKGEE